MLTRVAALSIINCCHFHALWHEVEFLADEGILMYSHLNSFWGVTAGLSSMAFLTSKSFVAHSGGSHLMYGTNPMAFGFPRRAGEPPLIWDQASAFMARGDISLHEQQGLQLPVGAAVGPSGEPTTDPTAALQGAQLTFGGHKGTSIALMVELLASMTGSAFSFEQRECDIDETSTTPTVAGEFILAIDPTVFSNQCSEHLFDRMELLFKRILEQDGTMLPSSGRHCGSQRYSIRAESEENGVEIPAPLYHQVRALCEE